LLTHYGHWGQPSRRQSKGPLPKPRCMPQLRYAQVAKTVHQRRLGQVRHRMVFGTQTYYNFCLPHASLCQALPQPEPTNGTGSAQQWRPCTPLLGAGLTEHVWTLREMLLYRVPPWPQPQAL